MLQKCQLFLGCLKFLIFSLGGGGESTPPPGCHGTKCKKKKRTGDRVKVHIQEEIKTG